MASFVAISAGYHSHARSWDMKLLGQHFYQTTIRIVVGMVGNEAGEHPALWFRAMTMDYLFHDKAPYFLRLSLYTTSTLLLRRTDNKDDAHH